MELKIELARRELFDCRLCGHSCGANRVKGDLGKCGLGTEAYVAESFIHIAEEAPINPSMNINLMGCGLRCRYCQQFKLLAVRPRGGQRLDQGFWSSIDFEGTRSLSFVGGNPDESIYAILKFLNDAPEDLSRPVVWNCHGYADKVVYQLLSGVVDCYIPDFKYWNDACAEEWSGVKAYQKFATAGIKAMGAQQVPVFVRLLVLPGHFACCHQPILTWLREEVGDRVRVRIMSQYHPDYLIRPSDGNMARRPTAKEVKQVVAWAKKLGLKLL